MADNLKVALGDLANEAEWLASLAYTLDEAISAGGGAGGYSGAAHILCNLIHEHKRKLNALVSGEGCEQ